jgi:Na+-driven multidrug efflux pump
MIRIVTAMMPIFVCGWGIFGIQSGVQCTLVGLGQAKLSLFFACLRKIILMIPLALILPGYIGVLGIFIADAMMII